MNKFDRVVSLLLLLQSKKVVKAAEAAAHFDVSLRTVYRDIRTLENAGIPIAGEAGIGYSILEGYHLPPVMFNEQEAVALVAAEKLVAALTDQNTKASYQEAMRKIKAVLHSSTKSSLDHLETAISFPPTAAAATKTHLPVIFDCIAANRVLQLHYQKPQDDAPEPRKVEPVGCYFHFSNWYLIAYCRLRSDYRSFKVNRIQQAAALQELFEEQHPPLSEFLEREAAQRNTEHVVVRFEKSIAQYTESAKPTFGFVKEEEAENGVIMHFLPDEIDHIARWLISYTQNVTILSPDSLKLRMQELTQQLKDHYL